MTKKKLVTINTRVPRIKEEKKKNPNRRLIFVILCFFVAICLVLYFEFSLGRISYIEVEGNSLLTDREVVVLSKVTQNDSFLELSTNQIRRNVMESSEIKSVEVDKVFPNKVIINVTEYEIVGYLVEENILKPLTEDGRILGDRAVENQPVQGILLYDFEQGDILQELSGELSKLSASIKNSISEIHYTPTELNEFLLNVYTNEGFRVIVPIQNFAERMLVYPSIVQSREEAGIINLETDGVFVTPFQQNAEGEEENTENEE